MPRRTDISSVLVVGSGPIVIGQAAEFDYSGTQACRVLREEGLRVILVNSNPATIMTDPEFADATYVEPITPEVVEKIIAQERPDAILPTLGGQTALNTAIALDANGVLEKYDVELIGANIAAINLGEDREAFKGVVERCGAESARSIIVHSMDEALAAAEEVDDLLVGATLVDGDAVGNESDLGDVGDAAVAELVHGEADVLQGDAGVQQALDNLEHEDVFERVQTLGAGALRAADRRADQTGARPVVELAVRDAGDLARDGHAVADLVGRADVEEGFLHCLELRVLGDAHVITPMKVS